MAGKSRKEKPSRILGPRLIISGLLTEHYIAAAQLHNTNAAGAQPNANANAEGAQQPIQLSPADIERLGRAIARELNRQKKSLSVSTIFLLVVAFVLLCGVGITTHAIWSAAQYLNRWIDGSCPLNRPNVNGTFWGLIGALLSKIWKH